MDDDALKEGGGGRRGRDRRGAVRRSRYADEGDLAAESVVEEESKEERSPHVLLLSLPSCPFLSLFTVLNLAQILLKLAK